MAELALDTPNPDLESFGYVAGEGELVSNRPGVLSDAFGDDIGKLLSTCPVHVARLRQ